MEEVKLNIFSYNRLKRTPSDIKNKKMYIKGNDLYKIYTFDPDDCYCLFDRETYVDKDQIERLASLQKYIKLSHLPRGIISYKENGLGVIYDYFDGYKSFAQLYLEDKDTIFENLKKATEAMKELARYEIYNSDLIAQNILYKGKDVELIDLDGPFVGSDYLKENYMYRYFMETIFVVLEDKLLTQYKEHEVIEMLKDMKRIINYRSKYVPNVDISHIEKIETLKYIK